MSTLLYLDFLSRWRLLFRTPGPLAFSSMNSVEQLSQLGSLLFQLSLSGVFSLTATRDGRRRHSSNMCNNSSDTPFEMAGLFDGRPTWHEGFFLLLI